MFGPPFGGMDERVVRALEELRGQPRHLSPMGGYPIPRAHISGAGVPLNGPFPLPGMAPLPMTVLDVRAPPHMGRRGMDMPHLGQVRPPMEIPDMMGAPPMRHMEDPRDALPRHRMPPAGGPCVGQLFDPSRVERNQHGHEPPQPGQHPRGPGQPRAKYERVKSLTPGGMSEAITIIRSREDGKLYVEKKVRTNGHWRKRTRAELEALKACRGHPNLNRLIEYEVKSDGLCSIILEYCDGGSVDQRITELAAKGQHFAEVSVWHFLSSVAKALAFLHTGIRDIKKDRPDPKWNTIAHLDLKPQNIFLSNENRENGQRRVILADFGCAVTYTDIQKRRENEKVQPCGTPAWYPPEGIAEDGYGTKTDIWMLGATIHVICLLLRSPHRPDLASRMPCSNRYGSTMQEIVQAMTSNDFLERPSAREIALAAAKGMRENQRR